MSDICQLVAELNKALDPVMGPEFDPPLTLDEEAALKQLQARLNDMNPPRVVSSNGEPADWMKQPH